MVGWWENIKNKIVVKMAKSGVIWKYRYLAIPAYQAILPQYWTCQQNYQTIFTCTCTQSHYFMSLLISNLNIIQIIFLFWKSWKLRSVGSVNQEIKNLCPYCLGLANWHDWRTSYYWYIFYVA
jgi:hypothetical protein